MVNGVFRLVTTIVVPAILFWLKGTAALHKQLHKNLQPSFFYDQTFTMPIMNWILAELDFHTHIDAL